MCTQKKIPHTFSLFAVFTPLVLSATLFSVSCAGFRNMTVTAAQIRINTENAPVDSTVLALIEPYKDSLSGTMDEVVGYIGSDLYKGKPESGLGDLVCNILLEAGSAMYDHPIDFAVYNYGGIRLDNLPAGAVTREKIFELLPFENFAAVINLDGPATEKLIDKIAVEDGWPVAGITMTLQDDRPANIRIRGEAFDITKHYRVIMNDYMVNGGDQLDFLPGYPVDYLGITVRDLVIHYFESQNAQGNIISAPLDGRIRND